MGLRTFIMSAIKGALGLKDRPERRILVLNKVDAVTDRVSRQRLPAPLARTTRRITGTATITGMGTATGTTRARTRRRGSTWPTSSVGVRSSTSA